ncbi:MAG: glycosyltransferase family 39 protein [Anaerolineae bacterium]|nr:glycosyltransferase family 39 protein [Anaerolineae bacterium]
MQSRIKKQINLPLLAILTLALMLRLLSLADHSLWYDEAFSVLFAQSDVSTMLSGTVNAVEHPLLYYLSLKGWMIFFGDTAFAVRLWSVTTGVATIGMMYLIGRDLFSKKTGLVAAFIVTVAPFHLQYSQETRMYSLLALLLMGATWCYIRGKPNPLLTSPEHRGGTDTPENEKSKSWLWWIAFGILAGLAMHTQYLAAFYLVALGLIPFIKRDWRTIAGVTVGATLAIIIFSPFLFNLPTQLSNLNSNYWINRPTLAQPLISLGIFMGGFHEFAITQALIVYGGALFLVVWILLQIGFYIRRPRRKSDSDNSNILLVLWLFIAPIVFMWGFSQIVPVYLERALIATVMMLYLLLAWLFTRAAMPRLIQGLLMLIVAVVFVIGDWAQYQVDTFPYSPVNAAMDTIHDNLEEGDVVIHMNKLTVLAAEVYAPDTHNVLSPIHKAARKIHSTHRHKPFLVCAKVIVSSKQQPGQIASGLSHYNVPKKNMPQQELPIYKIILIG